MRHARARLEISISEEVVLVVLNVVVITVELVALRTDQLAGALPRDLIQRQERVN